MQILLPLALLFSTRVSAYTLPTPFLRRVPLTRQSTEYSCGAAVIQSVLRYYGSDYNETELIKALGTTTTGTDMKKMARFAGENGIRSWIKEGSTLADVARSLHKRNPVIVDAQAWGKPNDSWIGKWWDGVAKLLNIDYRDRWDDGHFMVIVGLDKEYVLFMDPALLGRRGYLPRKDFLRRWHDTSSTGKVIRAAIFFDGKPAPGPFWQKIP